MKTIEEAAILKEKSWIKTCGYTLKRGDIKSIFERGAEWAYAHPKESDGCDFCKEIEIAISNSRECELSFDGEHLRVDIEIPLNWGSVSSYYLFDIKYCPFCGRKLKRL